MTAAKPSSGARTRRRWRETWIKITSDEGIITIDGKATGGWWIKMP